MTMAGTRWLALTWIVLLGCQFHGNAGAPLDGPAMDDDIDAAAEPVDAFRPPSPDAAVDVIATEDAAADGPCTATACVQPGGQYCGVVPNGCGGLIDCGDCPTGQTCGGGDVAHLCGSSSCTPISCAGTGYQYCGRIGDGCGHALDCPDCTGGATCGGGGTPNVCGH